MRPASENAAVYLTGSHELTYTADIWYGNQRVAEDVAITEPDVNWDSSAEVEGSGAVTIVWSDDYGTDAAPVGPSDIFAPFGARIVLFAVLALPGEVERIQLGDFPITDVPSVDGQPVMFGQLEIYAGSRIRVVFKDRMVETQRDRFTTLASPSQLTSVWAELGVLTGFQLKRALPDAAITRSVVYEESRVGAVQDLAGILGGVAFMDWDGTLTCRPIVAGSPVAELTIGEQGTIVQVGTSLSADGVYNGVIIRGETDSQQSILAERWVTEGPLRATQPGGERTPFHRVPRFYSSPFITTAAQAAAAAPGLLEQYSNPRATKLEVTCIVDPRLQVGDVVTVDDGRATWTVRLTRVPLGAGAVMTVTGDVIDRVLN